MIVQSIGSPLVGPSRQRRLRATHMSRTLRACRGESERSLAERRGGSGRAERRARTPMTRATGARRRGRWRARPAAVLHAASASTAGRRARRLHLGQHVLDAPVGTDDERAALVAVVRPPVVRLLDPDAVCIGQAMASSDRSRYGRPYFSRNFAWLFTLSGETPKTSTPVSVTRDQLSRRPQAWAVQPGVSSFG